MILSLKWQDLQSPPLSQERGNPQKKVCLDTVGRLGPIQSAPTKQMVSIYTLHGEAYGQTGHASDLQKIFYDFMQKGLSDTVMH